MVEVNIANGKLILLEELEYKEIKIPIGYESDGGTIKYIANIIFSNKDLYQGTRAFIIHDFMCEFRHLYTKKQSTQYLVNVWRQDGLNKWKAKIVKFIVNIFQVGKGWKKKSKKNV